jgi:hypothetical protein
VDLRCHVDTGLAREARDRRSGLGRKGIAEALSKRPSPAGRLCRVTSLMAISSAPCTESVRLGSSRFRRWLSAFPSVEVSFAGSISRARRSRTSFNLTAVVLDTWLMRSEVEREAKRRKVELLVVPTPQAIHALEQDAEETNAILHVTC